VIPAAGRHEGKLNLLAAEIVSNARPEDLIMFLDGDAFPIRDPMPVVLDALNNSALVAIRRDETTKEPQPHPSFCITSVREWDRLRGDWSPGYCLKNDQGDLLTDLDGAPITDVGANLLRALERSSTPWTPLLRSNRVNLHPLWFGVYGGIVYHHGAGFRRAISRLDQRPSRWASKTRLPVVKSALRALDLVRLDLWTDRTASSASRVGDALMQRIELDPEFYAEFV
jgi:hypothetical protein